jgi:prophage regulatory protein
MRIMRLAEVMSVTGYKKSSVYKYVALGIFPRPVPLTGRAVGWVSTEIEDWVKARIAERDQRSHRQSPGYLSEREGARG